LVGLDVTVIDRPRPGGDFASDNGDLVKNACNSMATQLTLLQRLPVPHLAKRKTWFQWIQLSKRKPSSS